MLLLNEEILIQILLEDLWINKTYIIKELNEDVT